MLGAIALVFHRDGNEVALAFAFAAVAGSFLVSYTRARAEALGLKGDVGIGSRAERVVVITAGLVLAPWGVLPWAIYLLAATAWFTVVQRVLLGPSPAASPAARSMLSSTAVLAPTRKRCPRPDARRAEEPPRRTRSPHRAAASTTSPSASSPPASPSPSSRAGARARRRARGARCSSACRPS